MITMKRICLADSHDDDGEQVSRAEVALGFEVGADDCMLSAAREVGGAFMSTWDGEDDLDLDDEPRKNWIPQW